MAVVNGLSPGISDAVVLDQYFPNGSDGTPLKSTYILIGVAGSVVYENALGNYQYIAYAPVGALIINATKILTSATVRGISRTTTASSMSWLASNKY